MFIATGCFLKQERRSLVMRCEESPWGRRVCEAKHSAFPETTNYRYDISTQPIWHKGPVVLVGDAIHAVSPGAGQGASLAVEDAIVLAKCLRDGEDHPLAFATYEHLRRERVEHMVKYGRSLGQAKIMNSGVVSRHAHAVLF
jgi:2-polyprenyl-6-methoxyphenol hydroxylase-like FAD-dependent oxidoreductase